MSPDDGKTASDVLYFTQKLDHFNESDPRTFQQKYLVNRQFCVTDNCPIFVDVGGESALPDTSLDGVKYADAYFGEQLGALLVGLEHRYYGTSYPEGDTGMNMTFLSSRQALADLVDFISFIADYPAKNGTARPKIIVQGGSYSGNLAAWARLRFPHLIDVALSSSAPVLAEASFSNYLKHIQEQIQQVGGCGAEVQETLATISSMINTPNADLIREAFNIKDESVDLKSLSEEDTVNLLEAVTDGLAALVQYAKAYNYDNAGYAGDIQTFCNELKAAATTEEKIKVLGAHNDLSEAQISFQAWIDSLRKDKSGSRSWMWQTCSEFGYYQRSDFEGSIFDKRITMDYFYEICRRIFWPEDSREAVQSLVEALVDETNEFYGARNIPRTQIYYTTGNVDPWEELTIQNGRTWAQGQFIGTDSLVKHVEAGSHCTDMYVSWKINDELRADQVKQIKLWLKL